VPEITTDDSRGSLPFTLGIVSVAALGGFLFGFDTAVINGAVPVLQDLYLRADSGFAGGLPLTHNAMNNLVGLSVAMALAGAALGAFGAGPIADKIGRKRSMVLAAALFLASAIGSGLPVTIWDFTFWRVLGGIAFGAASVLAPAYIAEVSPAAYRGRLASLQQLAIVIGIFVAQLSNFAIAADAGGAAGQWVLGAQAWRWMFWVEAFPAAVYGILALLIPESPRFLVAQSRDEDARSVLSKVLGRGLVARKIEEIHESLNKEHKPRLSDILARGGRAGFVFLPIVWLGIGLSVFQQFVGINVVFYYSNLLFQSVGFPEEAALLRSLVLAGTNVGATFIAIALVDLVGRKKLLLTGSAGMVVSLGVMAYLFGTAPMRTVPLIVNLPEQRDASVEVTVTALAENGERSARTTTLSPPEDGAGTELDYAPLFNDPGAIETIEVSGLPAGATVSGADQVNGRFTLMPKRQPNLSDAAGTVAFVAFNLFVLFFAFSWGPIVWVMLGEMFSNQIRGAGLAVAAAAQWAANFLISQTFPFLADLSLGFAYGFYAVSALLSFVFVLALIPETKGRELERMGELEQGRRRGRA